MRVWDIVHPVWLALRLKKPHQQLHRMQAPREKKISRLLCWRESVTEVKEGYKQQILPETAGVFPATPSQPGVWKFVAKFKCCSFERICISYQFPSGRACIWPFTGISWNKGFCLAEAECTQLKEVDWTSSTDPSWTLHNLFWYKR